MSIELLPFELGTGVLAFTTTRRGGVSQGGYASLNLGLNTDDDPQRVLENRRRLARESGQALERSVFMRQVHGDRIEVVDDAQAGRGSTTLTDAIADCDAMITRQSGLGLAVGHADCLAIVLVDPVARVLGVAHAGWRGALAGIAPKLVRRMVADFEAQPGRMLAGLSVCLGLKDLRLGEEQYGLFNAAFHDLGDFASPLNDGAFYLDLQTCCAQQLEACGLSQSSIVRQQGSTFTDPDRFFSHRRDQGKTGRMFSLAQLN